MSLSHTHMRHAKLVCACVWVCLSLIRSFARLLYDAMYISNERIQLVSRCRIFNSCLQVEIHGLASNTCSSFQQHLLTDFICTALNFPSHIHTIPFIRLHTIPSISCAEWGSINRLNRGFFSHTWNTLIERHFIGVFTNNLLPCFFKEYFFRLANDVMSINKQTHARWLIFHFCLNHIYPIFVMIDRSENHKYIIGSKLLIITAKIGDFEQICLSRLPIMQCFHIILWLLIDFQVNMLSANQIFIRWQLVLLV